MNNEWERAWLEVKGYEGFYEVSNDGLIKSLSRARISNKGVEQHNNNGEKILNTPIKGGYVRVHLTKDGKSKEKRVHRLVAEAFLPEREKIQNEVNHIDGNKTNNNFHNLEWCSSKENSVHAFKSGLGNRKANDTTSRKINKMSLEGEFIESYESIKQAMRDNDIKSKGIYKCCQGTAKMCGGFKWELVEDDGRIPLSKIKRNYLELSFIENEERFLFEDETSVSLVSFENASFFSDVGLREFRASKPYKLGSFDLKTCSPAMVEDILAKRTEVTE